MQSWSLEFQACGASGVSGSAICGSSFLEGRAIIHEIPFVQCWSDPFFFGFQNGWDSAIDFSV